MHSRTTIAALVGVSVFLAGAVVSQGRAQQGGSPMPDLPTGLTKTPGCLGIEMARTQGGKSVIFAWFESKKACMAWYYSETHQQAMDQFFPDLDHQKPLEGIPDDIGPIMVIASLTMADKSSLELTDMPISQIAIEIYKPIDGGLFLGGRFAPEALKIKDMTDYTPARQATDLSDK